MQGVDLNKPIRYINASLRFFKEGEHHVTRFCETFYCWFTAAFCVFPKTGSRRKFRRENIIFSGTVCTRAAKQRATIRNIFTYIF